MTWYLASKNDGLFIINEPPQPDNDYQWHERPGGPTVVLKVHSLPTEYAQAIVDAHNAALPAPQAGNVGDDVVERVAKAIYDILEGPIADQDFTRQTKQWELSKQIAHAAIHQEGK